MKRMIMAVIFLSIIVSVTTAIADEKNLVVLIPGWSGKAAEVKFIKEYLENKGMRTIIAEFSSKNLDEAAEEIYNQILKSGGEEVVLVGYSFGGLIAKKISLNHKEIKKIIQIGSQNNGYRHWLIPKSIFLTEKNKKVPLYIIVGVKGEKRWYLDGLNDGVTEVESAINIEAKEMRFLNLSHQELMASDEVSAQIARWLKEN